MPYQASITIEPQTRKRGVAPAHVLIPLIRDASFLKAAEIKAMLDLRERGKPMVFKLKDSADAGAAFEFVRVLAQLGVQGRVVYWASREDLPYLINDQGKIPGSEPAALQEPTAERLEILLHDPTVRIVLTGYGCRMIWIGDREKQRSWREDIQPQLIDHQNSQRRNDYPLYRATEWIDQLGRSYLFLWMSH
jgi:hypothetical protein